MMRQLRMRVAAGFLLVLALAVQGLPAAAATQTTFRAQAASRTTLTQAPAELQAAVRAALGPTFVARQRAELTASDAALYDNFGFSVAISGPTAVVGAPFKNSGAGAVYVFVRSGTAWTQQAELGASGGSEWFGTSVAISDATALVGAANYRSGAGAAYVFTRSGAAWTQQVKLTAADGAANDWFGWSVAISGKTSVVGAYKNSSSTGAAYVFARSGNTWSQQAKLVAADAAANFDFGYSVAISGRTAIVGAYGNASATGAAYVFVRSGNTWAQQAKLTASDGTAYDYFGWSVAVSGSAAVVGAFRKSSAVGAAYVFVRSGATWTHKAKLTASDAVPYDYFGWSVAISDSTVVVGAQFKNNQTGAGYVFVRSGTTWTQQAELTASDGTEGDEFGYSVAITGSDAVVGSFSKNSGSGAAYVLARTGTTWT